MRGREESETRGRGSLQVVRKGKAETLAKNAFILRVRAQSHYCSPYPASLPHCLSAFLLPACLRPPLAAPFLPSASLFACPSVYLYMARSLSLSLSRSPSHHLARSLARSPALSPTPARATSLPLFRGVYTGISRKHYSTVQSLQHMHNRSTPTRAPRRQPPPVPLDPSPAAFHTIWSELPGFWTPARLLHSPSLAARPDRL